MQTYGSRLDKIKPNGKSWDFDYEKAQELMLELIKKTESPEAATRFIETNLSNPKFRVELIEKALQAKDYRKVERLASEGVAKDEKEAPGRADNWRNYLLTVYRQTGNIKHVIELARYFLLHSNGHHHPLKYYYDQLKSLVPQDQWQDYLSCLINDINNTSPWIDYDRISQLYIWEAQWDKLFELLRQNASFDRLVTAEKYIADSYRDELAALYRKLILAYLERYMGRPHYQTVCRYIQRMIKFGASPMARNLIRELKTLYSNRGTLIDELNQI